MMQNIVQYVGCYIIDSLWICIDQKENMDLSKDHLIQESQFSLKQCYNFNLHKTVIPAYYEVF